MIQPAIVNVAECVRYHEHSAPTRTSHRLWALDYGFTPYGRYRAPSRSSPWRDRPAQVAHLYPPETSYWEDTRACPVPIVDAWITFVGGEAAGLEALVHGSRRYARFVDPSGRLGALVREVAAIGEARGDAGFWAAQSVLCNIIRVLCESTHQQDETYAVPAGETVHLCSELVRSVRAYLRNHLADRVTLAGIAGHAHVSPSTLTHRYRLETNETPMTTFTRMRVDRAKGMLLRGERLKVIAEETGFSDAYHLSKRFKRVVGVCPREFVRRSGIGV